MKRLSHARIWLTVAAATAAVLLLPAVVGGSNAMFR